jgi:hypothetical protein
VGDLSKIAHVRGVTVSDDGVTIEYTIPGQDVFKNGVMFNHAVFLPDDGFDELNATLRRVLRMAVAAAHESVVNPAVHIPVTDDDEVDEPGPYEYAPGQGPGETGAEDGVS